MTNESVASKTSSLLSIVKIIFTCIQIVFYFIKYSLVKDWRYLDLDFKS